MEHAPGFDVEKAHRHFSTQCFNRAWDYIDKPTRTPEEDQEMVLLSMASFWHWTQRYDCSPSTLSVGYWQLSRVHALTGQLDLARVYGLRCLEQARGVGTQEFHLGYAYEALARVEALAGDQEKKNKYLRMAGEVMESMTDEETRQTLAKDLETIPVGKNIPTEKKNKKGKK
jgi:hypothetical protein